MDPSWTSQQIKLVILNAMNELSEMDTEKVLQQRHLKFRKIGGFLEGMPVDPERKRNMKPADLESDASVASGIGAEIEMLRKNILEAGAGSASPIFSKEAVEKLQQ